MATTVSSKPLVQFESIGKFLQDVWLMSFLFIFIRVDTTISSPIVWIGILLLIAIAVNLFFYKTGYQIAISLFVSAVFGLLGFLFGAPLWFFAAIFVFSVWRIQERYSKIQEDATHDGYFMTLLLVVFSLSFFLATILRKPEAIRESILLAIIGLLLFMLDRMIVQWKRSKKENRVPFYKLVLFYVGIISVAAIAFAVIAGLAGKARVSIVLLFGDMIELILYPLGLLMEGLHALVSKFISPPISRDSQEKPKGQFEQTEADKLKGLDFGLDIPWVAILGSIILIILIIIVWRLAKNRAEVVELKENQVEYERTQSNTMQVSEQKDMSWTYSMETNVVRDAYRVYELEASSHSYTRNHNETIREWFIREGWHVSERFYDVYDVVRYSKGLMNDHDGKWFIEELNHLSKKYFKNEV
ncbi:hypothetical protein HMPREF1210_01360 [Paenisporosarcina sp. HGH0030]|uniref:hypothetical protein n=1 Tax=Paenisporosarcina sp. HGH0030 TaxID=1078085 RepID=UPI00034EB37D|nr:hypothetical protein [Paenisporosarcina sp. HGH0030]EPD52008.1 hypothetical protein HMPREF1210_01360 [Paenisporosarcina sp. HGH0030]